MNSTSKAAGVQYERQGDYLLPNLTIGDENEYHIDVWGQRYRRYLKEQHRVLYYNYLAAGTLNQHIAEVDKRASEMFEHLVKELAEKENAIERIKADDPMEWVRKVNNIRSCAM